MTFSIGNQTAGNINNVAGDQRITGGQQGIVVTSEAVRQAVRDLREALATTPLGEATAAEVRDQVEAIAAEVQTPQPDRPRAASSLERLTRLLVATGSLATAGAALVSPLQTLASWLGTLGEPILRLLPQFA
jgi:hypothetical protein